MPVLDPLEAFAIVAAVVRAVWALDAYPRCLGIGENFSPGSTFSHIAWLPVLTIFQSLKTVRTEGHSFIKADQSLGKF